MGVRAKFWCKSIEHSAAPGDQQNIGATIKLAAVYQDGDDTNKSWSKWTPSGELSMYVTNQAAIDQFTLGAYYFLDITPATAAT